MSEFQNTHDEDNPRFEPWLAMVASSVLPILAAFYVPKRFAAALTVLTVLLFVGGLVMLRLQSARRARERNGTQLASQPTVRATEAPLVHDATEIHREKSRRVSNAQLQLEDR